MKVCVICCLLLFVPSAGAEEVSVPLEGLWRYSAEGIDYGKEWLEDDFDDSAWLEGEGPIGYGYGNLGLVTMVSVPVPRPPTMYFRREFSLTPEQLADPNGFLSFRTRFDDGIVLHINGVEVWRDRMPDGDVTFSTFASRAAGGATSLNYQKFAYSLAGHLQLNGKNSLAVELHNASSGSSDSHFDLRMSFDAVYFGNVRPATGIDFEDSDGATLHRQRLSYRGLDYGRWSAYKFFEMEHVDRMSTSDVAFGSKVLRFPDSSESTLQTAQVDVRNFTNVTVSIDLATEVANGGLVEDDHLSVDIFSMSEMGFYYVRIPWLMTDMPMASGEPLLPESAESRVLVPLSAGELDPGWYLPNFDDSGWMLASGVIGYEEVPGTISYESVIQTDLGASMQGKNTSAFVRIPFHVAEPDELLPLILKLRVDDGFVVWLNGVRIVSSNAPEELSWNSAANGMIIDLKALEGEIHEISSNKSLLRSGENVLAVQAMNASLSSSDFLCGVSLFSYDPNSESPPSMFSLRSEDGTMTHFVTPPGLIPDDARSVLVRVVADLDSGNTIVYADNICISGDVVEPDSLDALAEKSGVPLSVEGDFDGDGIGDFTEYALGGDPLRSGGTSLPQFFQDGFGYGYFSYRQLQGDRSGDVDRGVRVRDVRYLTQFSTDAVNWRDGLGEPLFFAVSDDGETVLLRTRRPVLLEERVGLFRLRLEKIEMARGVSRQADPFAVELRE